MPYYCTVPRCTSMAGKVKNVSFHQFPRDEQLAKLWNLVLKRGKPYTKYSKVCSLHFKREDYTFTSFGKNKGQWRTLKKDAVPSQNLPLESPTAHPRRHSDPWPSVPPSLNMNDSVIQQQVAHAIYMQTMLAMQAASASNSIMDTASDESQHQEDQPNTQNENSSHIEHKEINSYKCSQCTKCFKDPDVFLLHQRQHSQRALERLEKENFNINKTLMVQSNPILVNLLKNNDRNIKNNHLGDYNDINFKMNQYLDVISKSNSLNSKINDNSDMNREVEKVMCNDNIQKLETNNLNQVTNHPISDEYTVNKSKISIDCDNKYFKNNRLNEDACEDILPCSESRIHFYTDCVNNTKIDSDDRLLFNSKRDYNDSKTNFDTIKQPAESETSNITNERINRLAILANTNYSIINDDTQRDNLIFDNGKMIESLIDYKLNDKTYNSVRVDSKINRSDISDSNLKDSTESNNFILDERVDFP